MFKKYLGCIFLPVIASSKKPVCHDGPCKKKFQKNLYLTYRTIIQGPSWQTGFFELAMTDRNMQAR